MRAQQHLQQLASWLTASSQSRPAPVWGALEKGPYAALVAAELNQSPTDVMPGGFEPEALVLFVPASQADGLSLPTNTCTPAGHDRLAQRLAHIAWTVEQGRLSGIQLIDLTDAGQTLQAAIDSQAPGIDLQQTAAVFLPRFL